MCIHDTADTYSRDTRCTAATHIASSLLSFSLFKLRLTAGTLRVTFFQYYFSNEVGLTAETMSNYQYLPRIELRLGDFYVLSQRIIM